MAQKRNRSAARRRRTRYEFKPDAQGGNLLKRLSLTQLQRRQLLRWSLFALICCAALILQDVILSRISLLGAATDLVPAMILLISVTIGSHQGSLFALVGSMLYYFAGSAPGPYVIALLSVLGVAGGLFREYFWRRGFASDVLCAACAMVLYEISLFGTGLFLGLTRWNRVGIFLLSALLSILVMLPMYPLVSRIDRIGGETWKE